MRSGAYERHAGNCAWCRAFWAGDNIGGPCPAGLRLARLADDALAAINVPATSPQPAPAAALALF